MESLGYVLIYLARGSLPWQGLEKGDRDRSDQIGDKKKSTPVEEVCEGLPDAFANYINYTRSLGFWDKVDYKYLRQGFRRVFASKGFKHDNIYDWTEKSFRELQGQAGESGSGG